MLRPPFIWGRGMTTINEMADVAETGRFAWIDHGKHIVDFAVHNWRCQGKISPPRTTNRSTTKAATAPSSASPTHVG